VQTNHDANPSSTSEPWMKTVVISTFGEFQKEIFLIIDSIASKSQYKDNSFVQQWKIYKNNARKPMCSTITWRNVKALLNIQDLHQYHAYLQRCPELLKTVRMEPSKATQSGFDYGIIPQSSPSETFYDFVFPSESPPRNSDKAVPVPELIEKSSCNPSPTIARLSIESSSQFQVFHHRIFATVYAWSYTSDQWNHINPETWRHAIETGMTENSTWDDVQKFMRISTFQEYYNSITDCTPLRQCYDFSWQDGKICYCLRQQVAVSRADSYSSTTCSDQTEQPANRDPVSSILHQDDPKEWLIVEKNGISDSFSDLHMAIYDCIQLWMDQPNVSTYPFYITWRRSVFSGLTKWTDWPRCSQILQLSSLRDYIDFVQQCPLVRDTFDLVWDQANECICYRECNMYQRNYISADVDKITRFQNQLRAVSNRFDKAFNQLEQRISNTQEKLNA
jgi:hypothetical protein